MNLFEWLIARKECKTCQELRFQLEVERRRFDILLNQKLNVVSVPEVDAAPTDLKPIPTGKRHLKFAERQRLIEEQDNRTLELMVKKHKEMNPDSSGVVSQNTDALEKEILNTNALEVNG